MELKEQKLRERVCKANKDLVAHGLVILSWGNVSGLNSTGDLIAIKPSGVDYAALQPADIVLVDLDGAIADGALKPSSDTPTHLELYRSFPGVRGVVHTHSVYATAWAQAGKPIPCLGTTHADHFHGDIPLTPVLSDEMIAGDYEHNTGIAIIDCMRGSNPLEMPACLVQNHGPFVWGDSCEAALINSVILETTAEIAFKTEALNPDIQPIKMALMDKHFKRKHGGSYGQG